MFYFKSGVTKPFIMARSNDHWTFAHGLCIGYLNINHIVNKMPDVLKIVHNNQNSDRDVHVFCFSESRLNSHIENNNNNSNSNNNDNNNNVHL